MASLDMSLDDMIKNRRSSEKIRGRGARRGRGSRGSFSGGRMIGAPKNGPLRVNARPSSHTIAKSVRRTKNFPWQHDLLEDSLRAAGLTGAETGGKLYVSNLDIGVNNDDIRELFSEMGKLKRYAVHYDKSGRPSGSAEVVYARKSDAFQALKRYNNVQLDGKPMKIEMIGTDLEVPISARLSLVGGVDRMQRTVVMRPGVGRGRGAATFNRGSIQRSRGGPRNARVGGGRGRGSASGRGRGGGGGRKKGVEKSADELDKELETYHAEASPMQT